MSNVHFNKFGGDYNLYNSKNDAPKTQEEEKKEQPIAQKQDGVAADKVLDAMSLLGAQNLAQVSNKVQIDPLEFLSEDRISSIEESMKLFEQGVEKYAGAVKEEFGTALGEKNIYALAAEAFSAED